MDTGSGHIKSTTVCATEIMVNFKETGSIKAVVTIVVKELDGDNTGAIKIKNEAVMGAGQLARLEPRTARHQASLPVTRGRSAPIRLIELCACASAYRACSTPSLLST